MNRSDLVEKIAVKHGEKPDETIDSAIKLMLETMTDALASGERIEIRGFGSFTLHHRTARHGRNPRNGEPIYLPAKHIPHFRPGKLLRERVNQEEVKA